ncbi:McrB family protein [Bacillus rhizoplanae]|uniref:McrB family protein n=1 Tax=Bacillus rhizoplanae TaxID=2880966 RepID=UPI003D21BD93
MELVNSNTLTEIVEIEDTIERCQRILDELQPMLRNVLDKFVMMHGDQEPYLKQLKVHGYEQTLKTTITDLKNPKYAEKKQHYGKKGFVELIDERYFETPLFVLRFEYNLESKQIRIFSYSDFYPFWVFSKRHGERGIDQLIDEIDPTLQVFTLENEMKIIPHNELKQTVHEYIQNKRTPSIHFGTVLPLEEEMEEEQLMKVMWDTFNKLTPVYSFLQKEAELHSEALLFLDNFKNEKTTSQLSVFSRTYTIEFKDVEKVKTNEFKQPFNVYDNGQLITDGYFKIYYRHRTNAKEAIGVGINNKTQIHAQIRDMISNSPYEWWIKKAFYHRGQYNQNNENQMYQEKGIEALKNHNFTLNDNDKFYLGTYASDTKSFREPMIDIKKSLITAALIFGDVTGSFSLPKGVAEDVTDDSNIDEPEDLSSSFDLSAIIELVNESGFTFSNEIIRDFHLNLTCLDDKHFVILNGISGTGKTQLCRLYANAVYGLDYSEDNPYLKVIPVRPDWMDATSLFGYYSSFEKRYMKTEFLEVLLQSSKEKDKPHFVVLDEMNLARVEYYMSDYLSAVESRKPIRLHVQDDITDVPKTIEIPHNFYLVGTINVDESTHSISDKVLDRAFVMTLSDVDFDEYWNRLDQQLKDTLQKEWELLLTIHKELAKYELHFGYRTMSEMLRKLYKNTLLPNDLQMDQTYALDRVITEKILPKLRGDERITGLLDEFLRISETHFGAESESYRHLERMRRELERYGATQFWR